LHVIETQLSPTNGTERSGHTARSAALVGDHLLVMTSSQLAVFGKEAVRAAPQAKKKAPASPPTQTKTSAAPARASTRSSPRKKPTGPMKSSAAKPRTSKPIKAGARLNKKTIKSTA
jgi:hypothetical protein